MRRLLCVVSVATISFGCTTAPKKFNEIQEGEFNAKVLIRDKSTNRSQIINADFIAIKEEKLRIDVTSTVMTHLASAVILPAEVNVLVPPDRVFYTGRPTARAMERSLGMPIPPQILHNILFDVPIENKNWECIFDEDNYLKECKSARGNVRVSWISRSGQERTIEIDHPNALLQFNIYRFRPRPRIDENTFKLEAPESFRTTNV